MTVRDFFAITNIRVQVVSLSPVLLGTLAALMKSRLLAWPELTLMSFSALAMGMGTTAWNTGIDYLHGVDTEQSNRDRSRVLVDGTSHPGEALLLALVLFAVGVVSGLCLSFLTSWNLIVIGILCLGVALFYSAGPRPFSQTPFGELVVALTQGSVLFCLSSFVQVRSLSPILLVLSFPSALFVALVLAVNNNCDREGDRSAGRRTLSILLGRSSRWLVPFLGVLGFALFLAACFDTSFKPWSAAIPALAMVLSVPLFWRIDRRGYSHSTKGPNMRDALILFDLFTVAMAVTLTVQLL
jgi:1,4-dihydroxy-2-naphthoate octaprenyltransferase